MVRICVCVHITTYIQSKPFCLPFCRHDNNQLTERHCRWCGSMDLQKQTDVRVMRVCWLGRSVKNLMQRPNARGDATSQVVVRSAMLCVVVVTVVVVVVVVVVSSTAFHLLVSVHARTRAHTTHTLSKDKHIRQRSFQRAGQRRHYLSKRFSFPAQTPDW